MDFDVGRRVNRLQCQISAWVYRDTGGAKFLSDLSAFEPKGWQAAIQVAG